MGACFKIWLQFEAWLRRCVDGNGGEARALRVPRGGSACEDRVSQLVFLSACFNVWLPLKERLGR